MFEEMERTILLRTKRAALSLVKDYETDTYSIALVDGAKPEIRFISKLLYELLIEELVEE